MNDVASCETCRKTVDEDSCLEVSGLCYCSVKCAGRDGWVHCGDRNCDRCDGWYMENLGYPDGCPLKGGQT